MLLLWFICLLCVSRDNGSKDNGSVVAFFETNSENMVAHESSSLAPAPELIIELSTCDCISEIEADKLFKRLTPIVISWSGDLTTTMTGLAQISFVRCAITLRWKVASGQI